jgi:hypothetical protein
LSKGLAFLGLVAFLLILNLVVGVDFIGNFLLGILSATIAVFARRFLGSNAASVAESLVTGIFFIPYFAYLVWFAVIGARILPAEVASTFLINYVTSNFVLSLPSTIVGGLGAWVVELVSENFR